MIGSIYIYTYICVLGIFQDLTSGPHHLPGFFRLRLVYYFFSGKPWKNNGTDHGKDSRIHFQKGFDRDDKQYRDNGIIN